MQEAQEKAKEQMDARRRSRTRSHAEPQQKMAIDVSTHETGQKKTINGFDCKQVITTITMHEEARRSSRPAAW